jgi:NAD(P)-dependent dehydrogenase (short-subunit alcohol dehydrogenase family)
LDWVLDADLNRSLSPFTPQAHGQGESSVYRTADGFEETIGVNHLGHFLLAQLLLPTLSKSTRARLVITASPVHDPSSGGGDVGAPASLGDLAGLAAGPGFTMVDGGPYDPDKAYKDSKVHLHIVRLIYTQPMYSLYEPPVPHLAHK